MTEMQAGPAGRIIWQRADGSSAEFAITAEVTSIGRDQTADIVIDEPLVSRIHARIERRQGRCVLIDVGSTNLTRVNGAVVVEHELAPGDELRFARARCRFESA
jgi:pSer/pThr/pTyr-binding forkhead associated (FHA) protein